MAAVYNNNLFDYKGVLVKTIGEDLCRAAALGWGGKTEIWRRCQILAGDSEQWTGKFITQYLRAKSLKSVSMEDLPLYLDKKYKSQEFLDMFK